jgi:hypothetical protein
MGGHSAWRKRVAQGGLAKEGTGGAIARHRPRMGRRGKDLKLNKKGQIGGGNPKKKRGGGATVAGSKNSNSESTGSSTNKDSTNSDNQSAIQNYPRNNVFEKAKRIFAKWVYVCISAWIYLKLKENWLKKKEENPFPDVG